MIKIGYYVKDEYFIQKVLELSSFNHEYLIYELESDDMKEINDLKLDLLIFDFTPDEIVKLERFENIKNQLNIKGICVFSEYSDDLVELVLKYHVRYLCDLNISSKALYVMILRIFNEKFIYHSNIYERIDRVLMNKNCLFHLKGTTYLKSALLYFIENNLHEFLMKDVYDTISRKHHSTSARVEKNIRSAIKMAGSNLSNTKFILECLKEIFND